MNSVPHTPLVVPENKQVKKSSKKSAQSLLDAVISGEAAQFLENEPSYIGLELRKWLLEQQVFTPSEYTNLSKNLRARLSEEYQNVIPLKIVKSMLSSKDKTEKFLFETWDKHLIEAVLIDNSLVRRDKHQEKPAYTLCLSSQVGCPLRCDFCATGMMNFARNLTAGEIVSQYLLLNDTHKAKIERIVYMGMGEPFLNREAVWESVRVFTNPWQQRCPDAKAKAESGLGMSAARISISTSGIIDGINHLAKFDRDVRLSISLHSAIQITRNQIMPDFKNVPLPSLKAALQAYSQEKIDPILIEYIMIKDVNDNRKHAQALARYVQGLDVKVNLIAYNHVRGKTYAASDPKRIREFMEVLKQSNIFAVQRYKKGDDIAAACGQLSVIEKQSITSATKVPQVS